MKVRRAMTEAIGIVILALGVVLLITAIVVAKPK
jgi:hypothetical protein